MTIGFGHGLAVSPLQLASAVSAIAKRGVYHPPTLLPRPRRTDGVRVVSASTSAELRKLMRLAVAYGTGGSADVEGYQVGGKTGTAEKVVRGGYRQGALISSFIGVFPIDKPRFVLLVIFDEPKGPETAPHMAGGGSTAAPVTGKIIARLGPLAGIAPQPTDPVPLPASLKNVSELKAASLTRRPVERQVSAPSNNTVAELKTADLDALLARLLGMVH